MPYITKKTEQCPASRPYGVFTETAHGSGNTTGKPHGCFATPAAAREQQKALYANVPDAKSADPLAPLEVPPMSMTEPQVRLPNVIAYRQTNLPDRNAFQHRSTGIEEMELRQSGHHVWRVSPQEAEERGVEPEQKRLLQFDGYASLFDRFYRVGPYTETIKRGAFKRSLGNPNLDVVLRLEHAGPPLASTKGRETLTDGTEVPTLQLGEDERGLRVHALLDPDDADVQRLTPKYRRRDLREMSFAFRTPSPGDDEWSADFSQRTIHAADLHRGDVSIVTYGASSNTSSSLRSEEAACELRSIGPEGLIGTLRDFAFTWVANHMQVHGKRETVARLEQRIGKVLSSDSMSTLRQVLQLASTASEAAGEAGDAADEVQAMLADLMGVPDPSADEDDDDSINGKDATAAPQLDHTGRSELACAVCSKAVSVDDSVAMKNVRAGDGNLELRLCHADCEPREQRNDPTATDWGINCDLKSVKQAIAMAKADQLQDPDYGDDSDDAAVMSALEEADAAIDRALVAQGKDNQAEDGGSEAMFMYAENDEDLYFRKQFSEKERKDLAGKGAAMSDGSYPIRNTTDLRNAIQAFGRAKNPSAVKAHIKKRARALGATDMLPDDWRAMELPGVRYDEMELELRALRRR